MSSIEVNLELWKDYYRPALQDQEYVGKDIYPLFPTSGCNKVKITKGNINEDDYVWVCPTTGEPINYMIRTACLIPKTDEVAIKELGDLILQNVAADGNCFFHAVFALLLAEVKLLYGITTHADLRKIMCDEINASSSKYMDSMEESDYPFYFDNGKTPARLRSDMQWVKNTIEIQAIANALDLTILVHDLSFSSPLINRIGSGTREIKIARTGDVHYQCVITHPELQEKKDAKTAQELQDQFAAQSLQEEEDAKTTQSLQEEDNRYSFLPLAGETGYEHHSQLNWFD
jgi:hypothetical protein